MNLKQLRIDVHHHIVPPIYARKLAELGIKEVAGAKLPSWTPEHSIAVMERHGIDTAITSLSAPGVYFGNQQAAIDLARGCNEFSADIASRYPGKFGSFAVLPMPFCDASCAEAEFVLDTLGAAGVVLLGSTDGYFLGDPRFDALMNVLNKRKAVVFIHPNLHKTSQELGLNAPGFLMEFLCDTSRAAVNLILTGTLEKFPNIRWILAHAGGFLPYIAWRISLANLMPEFQNSTPQGVMSYIKRFYFDTALSPSPFAMAALKELVGESQILFGSDFPFAPEPITTMSCSSLDALTIFDCSQKDAINRTNALQLFPQFRHVGESIASGPLAAKRSISDGFAMAARVPIIKLIDRVRNR